MTTRRGILAGLQSRGFTRLRSGARALRSRARAVRSRARTLRSETHALRSEVRAFLQARGFTRLLSGARKVRSGARVVRSEARALQTEARALRLGPRAKHIYAINHKNDANLSFNECVIDDSLTLFTGVASTEGRIAIYAISSSDPTTQPVHVTIVRDMRALETIQLSLHPIPEDYEVPAQFADTHILSCNSICLLKKDAETSGPVHIVCNDQVIFRMTAKYVDRYIGHLDKATNGRVSGWAIDLANESGTSEIELLINGVPYYTQRAVAARPDVANIYPSHTQCGFNFGVGLDEMPFESMTIRTRIKGASYDIPGRVSTYQRPAKAGPPKPKHQPNIVCNPVSVIVPIYNAPEELRECIESLLTHTDLGAKKHRLILSDDASPDPKVMRVLDDYDGRDGLFILRNAQNRGYTGNVNHGIEKAREIDPDGDVILLNSDTRVTPRWLEMLQRRALQSPSIGTVSAMSDNAGAFSVPVRNSINPIPPWLSEDAHARLVTQTSKLHDLRVPTTSGFCMYIKQAVFTDIGHFDEENFPRGYGEENDFCMRALHSGWEHAIADNVIIYHERSASFLDSKAELIDRASDLIPELYPEYGLAVNQGFIQFGDFNQTRFNISYERLRHKQLPRPRVAFAIGVDSGGTPQTNMDLMSSIQTEYEPYLLFCSTGALKVFKIEGSERILLETIPLRHRVMPIAHDSDSYRYEIADVLQRYGFELVHVRHIGRHGLSLVRIAKNLNIPVLFSLHDFYTVCPNVKLLDAENRYCGGRCTEGGQDCPVELWDKRFTPVLKDKWVHSWRKMFQKILPLCDGLITTSPYARDLIQSVYDLDDVPFHVVPHARDFNRFEQLAAPLTAKEPLRIFVPGNIVPAKGLNLIKDIKALDTKNKIEFHFAGLSKDDLSQYGVYHGPYERADFGQLVEKINPHVGAVLSIWPETYSHTLTELWSCGLPVVTSNYGATGERVAQHGGGWACGDMSAEGMFDFCIQLASNRTEVDDRRAEVLEWQAGYGQDYSLLIMSERYKQLYHGLLNTAPQTEAMAIAFGGYPDAFMPTQPLQAALEPEFGACKIMVWPVTTLNLLDLLEIPEILIIRYHAEPDRPDDMQRKLAELRATSPAMKLIVDVAPDAFIGDLDQRFLADRPILGWLFENADRMISPAEHKKEPSLPGPIDLTVMVPNAADHARLPEHPVIIDTALTPADSLDYKAYTGKRLDAEVLPGASKHLYRHNTPFASANFTMIDWDAMLSRPRVPGLVSFVIPTFNRVGLTEKFLQSILKLTKTEIPFEIIIIDNGSVPEARVQIEALADLDPRVKVVCSMVPLMFSVGCNYGASFATGEYILFLNNDMEVVEPDWLDELISPLTQTDEIGLVGGRLLFGDRTIQHAGLAFSAATNLAYHIYLGHSPNAPHVMKQREMQAVTGACMAMRAVDWAKLRGFNPLFVNGCEDVDLCLRMSNVLQRKILYVPTAMLLHHEGKSPGRGRNILQNRLIFNALWGGQSPVDDMDIYAQDGFKRVSHTTNDEWLAASYRAISVDVR